MQLAELSFPVIKVTKGIIMGKRLKKRQVSEQSLERSENVCEQELIEGKTNGKSSLSIKDFGVILIMSTLISISLVTATVGIQGIRERLDQNELSDILLSIIFLICLFAILSFILVKVAAHYLVYLAVATFCGIVFPVSPQRQRKTIEHIYDKAKK